MDLTLLSRYRDERYEIVPIKILVFSALQQKSFIITNGGRYNELTFGATKTQSASILFYCILNLWLTALDTHCFVFKMMHGELGEETYFFRCKNNVSSEQPK